MDERAMKKTRWYIIFSAMLMQLCLGSIYAWGVFLKPIMEDFGWTTTEVSLAFTFFLVSYAGGTLIGGRLQDLYGPRLIASIGGIMLGLGYILASYTQSLPWLYLTYGVIGGSGVGLGYACPIATSVKWFPDKRGLATGLAVAGFGAGALIFAPIATKLIALYNWQVAFRVLGATFVVVVLIAAQMLKNPPRGWNPRDEKDNQGISKQKAKLGFEMQWQQMIKTMQFWMLWLMFAFGATAGLMVIGHLASYGVEVGLTESAAALVVGTLAIFNGSGRIVWGMISDKIGRSVTLMLIMFTLGVTMLIFVRFTEFSMLLVVAGVMGLAFGGILAVFPSITADYFGTMSMGTNYGVMFSAYGAAGILGPLLGASVYDYTGTYFYAGIIAGALCFAAGGIALFVKPPVKPRADDVAYPAKYRLESD